MAMFKFSISFKAYWEATIILQFSFALMMPLPWAPDMYIRPRDIHLQARIHPHTGNVTLAMLCDPYEEDPVPSDAPITRAERYV